MPPKVPLLYYTTRHAPATYYSSIDQHPQFDLTVALKSSLHYCKSADTEELCCYSIANFLAHRCVVVKMIEKAPSIAH